MTKTVFTIKECRQQIDHLTNMLVNTKNYDIRKIICKEIETWQDELDLARSQNS